MLQHAATQFVAPPIDIQNSTCTISIYFRCIGCLVCSILHDFFRCDLTTSRVSKKKLVVKQDFNPLPDIDNPPNPRALEASMFKSQTDIRCQEQTGAGYQVPWSRDIHTYGGFWPLSATYFTTEWILGINQAPRQWQSILGQDFCMLR